MKKIILTSVLLGSLFSLKAQQVEMTFREVSPYIIVAGVSITVAAFVTPMEYTVDYHSRSSVYESTPIYNQTARFAGIVSGVGITVTGITGLFIKK